MLTRLEPFVLAGLLMLSATAFSQSFPGIPPKPIPEGPEFPRHDLKSISQEALDAHAWKLFTLVSDDERPNGKYLARWRTWCTVAEIFESAVDCVQGQRDLDDDSRLTFSTPRPHEELSHIISTVYFSPPLAAYFNGLPDKVNVQVQPGKFSDKARTVFEKLLSEVPTGQLPAGTGNEVAVKVAWSVLSCPTSPSDPAPTIQVWDGTKLIGQAIDPSSLKSRFCTPNPSLVRNTTKGLPKLDEFFFFQRQLDDPGVFASLSQEPVKGDYLVVSGMHIITLEEPSWVWATFWLTNQPRPFAQGSDRVTKKAAHFAMKVSLNEQDVIFNPFLEGKQEGGKTDNCLNCHKAASVYMTSENALACPGVQNGSPAVPANALRTGFLWTLATRVVKGGCQP